MGKGEIARYKQILLFPLCFHKACFQEVSKGVIVWEWVNNCIGENSLQLPNMVVNVLVFHASIIVNLFHMGSNTLDQFV